jgi:S1-C subfamily serine protease
MHATDVQPLNPPHPAPRHRGRLLAGLLVGGLVVLALLAGLLTGLGRGLLSGPAATRPAAGIVLPAAQATGAAALQDELMTAAQRVGPAVVSIRTETGLGSGLIYDASGLVLTNAHVVDGSRTISVGLADGRHFDGKVLGADQGFDLAVVKIGGDNLPTAPLGGSASLQVGQFVLAIGNPYGFDHTVTNGVVSALNRPIAEDQRSLAQPMIQTNAAINPGNSGGPLVDLDGSVVGITTLVAAPQGFPAQGLGFAVPIDTARRIAPQLVADGRVTHSGQPYLGLAVGDPGSADRSQYPYRRQPSRGLLQPGVDHGALIAQVAPGGPAAAADLKDGDVITSFDGRDVYAADDFLQDLVLHQPGDQVQLGLVRQGQQLTVQVTIGEAPAR